jgi:hypothetical protein
VNEILTDIEDGADFRNPDQHPEEHEQPEEEINFAASTRSAFLPKRKFLSV